MLPFLFPRIAKHDLAPMLWVAVIGGLIGGAFGIVHDQITYSISSEYFTKMKFHQFHYADFGLGDRVFASTIGLLATGWVGFLGGWILGRRYLPNQPRARAYRQIRMGMVVLLAFGVFCGALGYIYGLWRGANADYSSWQWAFEQFEIGDRWAFARVAYIHNAGYLGAVLGVIVVLTTIRRKKAAVGPEQDVNGRE